MLTSFTFRWEQLNSRWKCYEMLRVLPGTVIKKLGGIQFWDKTHVEQFCCWTFDSKMYSEGRFLILASTIFSFPFWNHGTARFNRQPSSIKVTSCVFLRQKKASTTTIIAWRLVGSDLLFFFVDGTCMAWWLGVVVWFAVILRHIPIDEHESHFLFLLRYRLVHYQSINPMGVFDGAQTQRKDHLPMGRGVVKVSLHEALKVAVLQARSWRL